MESDNSYYAILRVDTKRLGGEKLALCGGDYKLVTFDNQGRLLEKPDDKLDKDDHMLLTDIMVTNLSANIHISHQKNMMDSAEHLRMVIRKLEELFVMQIEKINK